MCMVYSSYVYENLKKRHISCHIIDTNDLSIKYEHRFVLVPTGNKYYLVDLTFSQFKKEDLLPKKKKNGYDIMDNDKWTLYLNTISNSNNKNIDIDIAYYK